MNFDLDTIVKQINEVVQKGDRNSFSDESEWKLTKDEKGNGSAIIRFLPSPEGLPIVKIIEHNVWLQHSSGKKRGYMEKSPSTIGKECPVTTAFFELKNSGIEEAIELSKELKVRKQYIANIYVIKDPQNPSNEGKVFYYKFGQKIMDKILQKIQPPKSVIEAGVKPVNIFDPYEGANFTLIFTAGGQYGGSYDSSEFNSPSALFPDKSKNEIEQFIKANCFNLEEKFLSPETFKSYEELRKKFAWVIAGSEIEKMLLEIGSSVITEPYDEIGNPNKKIQVTKTKNIEQPKKTKVEQKTEPKQENVNDSEDDDIDDLMDEILGD